MVKKILIMLLICNAVIAKEVTARLNKYEVNLDDTINLTVDIDNGTQDVDINGLTPLFHILGKQTSMNMISINGDTKIEKKLIISLMPKKTGKLVIPSLKVGDSYTEPITVTVGKNISQKNKDILVEVELDNYTPFIGGEVIYNLKIFMNPEVRFNIQQPDIPKHKNIKVYKVDVEDSKLVKKDGRTYELTELKYLIYPQAFEDIKIPGIVLEGSKAIAGSRFGLFSSFVESKPVRITSDEVTIKVRPRPNNVDFKYWLPAKKVNVTVDDLKDELKQGEPVIRSVKFDMHGFSALDMPKLELNDTEDVRIFVDESFKKDNITVNGLRSVKEYKITYIPKKSGKITIPGINFKWWDINTESFKEIDIEEKVFNVIPSVIENKVEEKQVVEVKVNNLWFYIACISIFFNLIFIFNSIKKRIKLKVAPVKIEKMILKACRKKDLKELSRLLLIWGKKEKNAQSLKEVAKSVDNAKMSEMILKLNECLYSGKAYEFDFQAFSGMISYLKVKKKVQRNDKGKLDLPSLNNL